MLSIYCLMLFAGARRLQMPPTKEADTTLVNHCLVCTHTANMYQSISVLTHTELKYTADRNPQPQQSAWWETISTVKWNFYFETLGSLSLRQCLISKVKLSRISLRASACMKCVSSKSFPLTENTGTLSPPIAFWFGNQTLIFPHRGAKALMV